MTGMTVFSCSVELVYNDENSSLGTSVALLAQSLKTSAAEMAFSSRSAHRSRVSAAAIAACGVSRIVHTAETALHQPQ